MFKYILLLFLFSSFCIRAYANPANDFELAMTKFESGDLEAANIYILKAIEVDNKNVSHQLLLAEILIGLNKSKMAIDVLSTASSLGADYNTIYVLKSKALIQLGEYQQVLDSHQQITNQDDTSVDIYVARGLAWFGLKNIKQAKENLLQALFIQPNHIDAKIGLTKISIFEFDYEAANKNIDSVLGSLMPPVEALNLKAVIAQQLGIHSEAFKAVQAALIRQPNNLYSKLINASLNVEVGNLDTALLDIKGILSSVENEPRALFLSALIAIKKQDKKGSNEKLNNIEKLLINLPSGKLDENPNFYYLLALVLFQLEKFETANLHLDSYLALDKNNIKALNLKALLLLKTNQYNEALITLKKANSIKPNDVRVIALQGVAHQKNGDSQRANQAFKKVLDIKPDYHVAVGYLAQSYLALGETELAISSIKEAEDVSIDAVSVLVNAYLQSNNFEEALRVSLENANTNSHSFSAQHLLASVYHFGQEYENAKNYYQKALVINEDHKESIIGLAYLSLHSGKGVEAIKALKEASLKFPSDSTLIRAISEVYQALGDIDESTEWLKKEYENSPSSKSITELISAYRRSGQNEKAKDILGGYLANGTSDFSLHYLFGELQIELGEYAQAIVNFKNSLKSDVNKGEIYYRIAQTYYVLKDLVNAETYYKKSIAWSEQVDLASTALVKLYLKTNQSDQAIKTILQYEALYPLTIPLAKLKANIYLAKNDMNKAEDVFKKLFSLGALEDSAIGLAQINMHRNRISKAMTILKKAEETLPKSLLIKTLIAQIHISKSDWQSASSVYDNLLEFHPNNAALLNNAAYIQLTLNNLDEAQSYAEQSIALFNNHPDSLHTLGLIYYKQKRFEQALPLLRKAVALKYKYIEAKYHLALTLKAMNRDNEALSTLVEIVESGIDFPDKQKALSLVQEWSS